MAQPQPFAFMRMTHEAIRVGLTEVQQAAMELTDDRETQKALQAVFQDVIQCIGIHMKQENDAFFPMLDAKFESIATRSRFYKEHDDDHDDYEVLWADLKDVLTLKGPETAASGSLACCFKPSADVVPSIGSIQQQFLKWVTKHQEHLAHEEEVMMPLTQKLADTVEGRARKAAELLEPGFEDFKAFQLGYVVGKLAGQYEFLSLYLRALQAISTAAQYEEFKGIFKPLLSDEVVTKLTDDGIMGEGTLVKDDN